MKYLFIGMINLAFCAASHAQHKQAYVLFDSKGKKIAYGKMLDRLQEKDIILFGEFHNNPISHWLQLELSMDLFKTRRMVMGAEMFERDNQDALDLYLRGEIEGKGFDSAARLWRNYHTDYAPLVNFAKDNGIPFVATNVPRRYASAVAGGGFAALDTLSQREKAWIAPTPIAYDSTLPGYKNMLTMMPGHGGANLPKAQALKDATMAHFILHHYIPGAAFLHFNGAYHSENYEGILWYLQRARPGLRYATITTVSQKDPAKLLPENKGKADFIICVDEQMTTTY